MLDTLQNGIIQRNKWSRDADNIRSSTAYEGGLQQMANCSLFSDTHQYAVEAWVDGGCEPNPGFGAFGSYLMCNGSTKKISGIELESTNQRAEILAAIITLEALKTPCQVKIMSDSQYVICTMSQGWSRRVNLDLWDRLDKACEPHEIKWVKVKAHQGKNLIPHNLVAAEFRREGLMR